MRDQAVIKSNNQVSTDTEKDLELAHRYWNEEVAGSNALLTRWKRLVFRVPHYNTTRQAAN
jgi:hypothetical protein